MIALGEHSRPLSKAIIRFLEMQVMFSVHGSL
jgi:hypothetical protein